jgi:hypothetical protein
MSETEQTPKTEQPTASLRNIFDSKYFEFATDLKGALPELEHQIRGALAIPKEDRARQFSELVMPTCQPHRDMTLCPGIVLPGVVVTEDLWQQLSDKSKEAIQEYLTLLSFCCVYEGFSSFVDLSGNPATHGWYKEFLKTWRDKMSNIDFTSLSSKIADLMKNLGPEALPKIPERLLKGHLAKLAEELVREFRPEDFGLTAEQLAECDKDPSKAFQMLTDVYTTKPELLQGAIQRIAKRLQDKIKRGELRPEQIAAEAEELMKQFSENGAFVDMLSNFKSVFGMEDPDLARAAGREQDARRNIVKERLRKKLDAKRNGKK